MESLDHPGKEDEDEHATTQHRKASDKTKNRQNKRNTDANMKRPDQNK